MRSWLQAAGARWDVRLAAIWRASRDCACSVSESSVTCRLGQSFQRTHPNPLHPEQTRMQFYGDVPSSPGRNSKSGRYCSSGGSRPHLSRCRDNGHCPEADMCIAIKNGPFAPIAVVDHVEIQPAVVRRAWGARRHLAAIIDRLPQLPSPLSVKRLQKKADSISVLVYAVARCRAAGPRTLVRI